MSVTILLATYNGARFLPQLLSSLQQQRDVPFSVLMQDDGSTDETPALLRHFADEDSRFTLAAESDRHFGSKGNFISLIRQCSSRYTALCDQDDVWEPHKLARCLSAMQKAEARYGADVPLLIHSDAQLVDENGAMLQPSFFRHQGWDPAALTLPRMLVQNNVTGCTLLMNAPLRDLIARYAEPDTMHMHDWFIALTASAFGHILFVDEPLVRYRQHGVNVVGASRATLWQRGIQALSAMEKGKARIALTYDHTRAFLNAYGPALPAAARQEIEGYLSTQTLCKPRRIAAVFRGGYTMQSPITRIGQIFFG